jgi:hypothetical protein
MIEEKAFPCFASLYISHHQNEQNKQLSGAVLFAEQYGKIKLYYHIYYKREFETRDNQYGLAPKICSSSSRRKTNTKAKEVNVNRTTMRKQTTEREERSRRGMPKLVAHTLSVTTL